jgi:hypothetical protein
MGYDFSKPETQAIFEQEVRKRTEPPLNMSRAQAEMLVAVLMWSPPPKREVLDDCDHWRDEE